MKLLFKLPNGEVIDLLDESPNGMDYICQVHGEYDIPVSQLLEDYQHETDEQKRLKIADEIRDQSRFFAGEIANYDEELQQMIGWDDLAEQIYQCVINQTSANKKIYNVDIHWDFAKSVQVEAVSKEEAASIVDEMIRNGKILATDLEPTDDFELNTDWQPED